jgi:hypothetical protein
MATVQGDDYARFERSLTNHTPTPEEVEVIERIRERAKDVARLIIDKLPPSRERSLALTHLEDSTMWAVKAVVLQRFVEET